jgi:galactoside O-acetyltransferase
MKTDREKMTSGELYFCSDEAILSEQEKCLDMLYDYNQTRPTEGKKRTELLKKMCAECGENVYIEPPFHSNWGGKHCHFGKNVYANFNLTCVDDTHIYIGEYTMLGPNVVLSSAGHPILPELREKIYQYNMPIHIGRNCWLGAGVVVLPGITIGDGSVIGAGSIVTKDIPSGVVAVGNPCRVLREISDRDREYYFKDKKINWDEIK